LKNGAGGCFGGLSTGSAPSRNNSDSETNGGLGSSRAVDAHEKAASRLAATTGS
jgi:hypothetical protein